jgi:hypothetical protein
MLELASLCCGNLRNSKWPNTKSIIRKSQSFATSVAQGLYHRQFLSLLFGVNSQHEGLLYYTEIRCYSTDVVKWRVFLLHWKNRSCYNGNINYHTLTYKDFGVLRHVGISKERSTPIFRVECFKSSLRFWDSLTSRQGVTFEKAFVVTSTTAINAGVARVFNTVGHSRECRWSAQRC